jgi:G3E family GTPase
MSSLDRQNNSLFHEKDNPCLLVIIAGFLGSGKTTLLKRFIDWETNRGNKPCVVMSEFGDLDIDSTLLSSHQIRLKSITGGCACCDLREELVNALTEITGEARGATIFMESTGVGDPAGIMEAVKPLVDSGAVLIGNVIVVYDASRRLLEGKDSELVERQLKTADTILINKSDLMSPLEIQEAVDTIGAINPSAEITATSQCSIDIKKALGICSSVKAVEGTKSTSGTFRSFGFQIEDPLSQKALEKWLKNLPPSVIRAKGFVKLDGQKGFFEVQATRGFVNIAPVSTTANLQTTLILIAHPMRTDRLVRGLMGCVA